MSVTYTCDGCGATQTTSRSFKPHSWYGKTIWLDDEGQVVDTSLFGPRAGRTFGLRERELHACSRPCIEAAAAKCGVDSVVSPF